MILRCVDSTSVAVVLHNRNIVAIVTHFALLDDDGKLIGANRGSKVRSEFRSLPIENRADICDYSPSGL